MNLIVGVNADGVLTDTSAFNIREGSKYFKKEPVNPAAYHTCDMFGVSKRSEVIYGFRGALNKYCKKEPPRPHAVEALSRLSVQDMEFHEITARKFAACKNVFGKYYRRLFEKWLKKHGLVFQSIQYCSEAESLRDKYMGCSKLMVDVMIEDKPDVALFLAEKGVPILLMDAPYNQGLEHVNIKRVYDWLEIEKELLKRKEEIVASDSFQKLDHTELEKLSTEEKRQYFKSYHEYLKGVETDTKAWQRGRKRFRLVYGLAYLPIKLCYRPLVCGREQVPCQDGFIIAGNHLSSKDQYLLGYALGNRHFSGFAASTIEKTFRGRLFQFIAGAVFIDRKNAESKQKGEEKLSARVVQGGNALIFPEGTRKNKTEGGRRKEQLPFKLGTVAMAQKMGAPILPVSIYWGKRKNYVKIHEMIYVLPKEDILSRNAELEKIILEMTRKSVREDEKR